MTITVPIASTTTTAATATARLPKAASVEPPAIRASTPLIDYPLPSASARANFEPQLNITEADGIAVAQLMLLVWHKWQAIHTRAVERVQILYEETAGAAHKAGMPARNGLLLVERQQIHIR